MEWIVQNQIFLIDNFFDNVEEVREYALRQKYFPPDGENWVGFRSEKISFGNLFTDEIILEIAYHMRIDPRKISCYFHYTLSSSKNLEDQDFDNYKFHADSGIKAGVIYLNPNPPVNSGTTIFINGEEKNIENQYNRFLCYNSKLIHGPMDTFGETIDDSRLTLTFFV